MVTYPQIVFNVPLNRRFSYSCEQEVFLGSRVKAPFGKRRLIGCVVAVDSHPPEGVDTLKSVESLVDKEPLFGEDTLELAQWMANLCMCSLGEALFSMLPGGKRESKKLQEEGDQEASSQPRILTDQQQVALDGILSRQDGWNYLYGLTGSGKTEVFLRAAEATIEEGRGVIYLVPEIALSHQLVDGLKTRFPGKVAVIHSGLTPSRRLAEWNRIRNGEAPFVLGARSAVFAPLPHLGLLILDEEHEGSYKSGSTPRYHARQVAMRRSRVSQARLLMGSATPSVESWFLMNRGSMTRHTLTGRPAGGAPPTVQVVNLAGEQNVFSKTLVQAMSRVLGEGRQVLLFLNRRGFSYQYACQACGEEVHCRHCSVPLTYHKARRAMVCHYCGYRTAPPHSCPECGSVEMRAAGFGTERIEEDVARLFPEKKVLRLDADAVKRKGALEEGLRDFREGRIDILLGTQMVAKGLNAPGVKLAAVLSADTSLNLPDFRSSERTFALILQVAGRAGRFIPDGEVIVQSFRPSSPAVRLAAEGQVEEFYTQEIEERQMLGFPPFSRLFRITIRGKLEARVRSLAQSFASDLAPYQQDFEVLGPAECPIGRISEQYRWHIILRTEAFDRTHAALNAVLQSLKVPHGLYVEVDVDPVSLL